ncbi:MAG: LuxR C-terminal-related transcriptional regulator [Gaiellales bacterium]
MADPTRREHLEQGREAYARRAWADAYAALSQADVVEQLGVDDLELLATSASMTGRVDDHLTLLERIHHMHLDSGDRIPAVRAAFWAGMTLATRGEPGPAGGWFARAQRLVEREEQDCAERGYLLVPFAYQQMAAGEYDEAHAAASQAHDVGERFNDAALMAVGLLLQGEARVRQGLADQGLSLLDEAMVAISAPNVPPILTGVIYCGVIACCEEACDPRRAQDWTASLTRWCEEQPQLVSFTGRCLAHRAGIMQLHGAWDDALAEAVLARERCEQAMNHAATGQALYQQAELHRLRGDFSAAEAAYQDASRFGREPQPGLALLRLMQGDAPAAAAALRRVLAATSEPMRRAVLLPAYADAMLAVPDGEEARRAADELAELAAQSGSAMVGAMAARVRGATALAEGRPKDAVDALRIAVGGWQDLSAPYEVASARLLMGVAFRALGDEDGAAMELGAARSAFDDLGALPDVAHADTFMRRAPDTHGLTAREVEVLRLVAAGKTNRQIAAALVVSEHTVARHLQNIFAKLRVSTRAAATAFAFEHDLV